MCVYCKWIAYWLEAASCRCLADRVARIRSLFYCMGSKKLNALPYYDAYTLYMPADYTGGRRG